MGTIALGLVGGLIASKLLFRRRFGGFARHRRYARGAAPPVTAPRETPLRLDRFLSPLELSQRQAEEARESFADVAQALGARWRSWPGLEELLAAAATEPFDAARARATLGGLDEPAARLAVDALEHFHNILLPEQREKLASELAKASEWR